MGFVDEDEEQLRFMQLTNQHKAAIRAIRKVRNCFDVTLLDIQRIWSY